MLNRYQTGPLVTVRFIASALALCGFGLFGALRFHNPYGWLSTLNSLLLLFVFHQHFGRHKN
jgi:hypothetical protein